ncbi:MAG: hypothetical protein ACXADB_06260 [Candidatus Hermodarchaeia archaeon]|jgi:hypothetical protein
MGEEEQRKEVTPETEACPKSPEPKKEKPSRPLLSYFPKWNRTQIIAITLTTISLVSIFSVGRWYLLMIPLQEDNVISSNTYGGPGDERLGSFIQLDDGGFAFCGSTTSWGLGGQWTGTGGGTDMWLTRLDENANILWNRTYGTPQEDSARSVIECNNGGFSLLGITDANRSGDYDPDCLLVRLDENGNQLWNTTFGDTEREYSTSLVQCNDGGFAFTVYTVNYSADHTDLWLVRTDSAGNLQWNHTYECDSTQEGASLIETESGYLLFTSGAWWSTGIDTPYNDAYLICTDANGNFLWNRTYDSGGHDYGFKIIPENTGGYTLACLTGPNQRGSDLWLIRINENGDILWQTTVGLLGARAGDVIKCYDGGYAITGSYSLTQWWIHHNLYFARTDTQGNVLWHRQYGYEEIPDFGVRLLQMTDGSFQIAGGTGVSGEPDNTAVWLLQIRDTPITYYTLTQFLFYGALICFITLIIFAALFIAQRRWLRS